MNKSQVFEVMAFLRDVYPSFEFDQDKLNTWHRLLKDQNPERVKAFAERHAMEQKFPPTIAELRERKQPYDTDVLSQIKEWEQNAARKQ